MGFSIETSVSAVTVFLQGALSFFSPCVLPLVPLYVSYLAGGAAVVGEDGVRRYPRGKIFLNTLFFVVGISFAFFLLGLGLTALGEFFHNYQVWFARASGVIILLFGLYQLGLGKRTMLLEQEHHLPFHLNKLAMNPAVALVMGFTFSFAWTPCVGPAPDFTQTDQDGQSHPLSDYQGKTVFLNFWATWCGPCKMEMPDIQALYEDWDENAGELVVLGVAGPNIGQEGSAEDITAFLEENGYTYPVVMDETGTLFYQYGISAYPTTFMIDTEGNVFGYVQGAVSREVMDDIVEQTRTGQRR